MSLDRQIKKAPKIMNMQLQKRSDIYTKPTKTCVAPKSQGEKRCEIKGGSRTQIHLNCHY